MKTMIGVWIAAFALVCTLGLAEAFAAPASHTSNSKVVELTGCLQQGPVAREYLLDNNGTAWGVNETSALYLNHYVGQKVTITGNAIHPTMSERKDGGAHHYLEAMDVAVDAQHCQ